MIGLVLWLVAATVAAAGYTAWHGFSYRRAFEVVLQEVESGIGYARPLGGFVLPGFLILGVLLLPFRPLRWLIRWSAPYR